MEEQCRYCKGSGYYKEENESKYFCKVCGGYGVASWISNVTGTPEREPVMDVIQKIIQLCAPEIRDKIYEQKVSEALDDAFKDTNVIVDIEKYDGTTWYLKTRRRNGELEKQA